jgi:hypothetical protein
MSAYQLALSRQFIKNNEALTIALDTQKRSDDHYYRVNVSPASMRIINEIRKSHSNQWERIAYLFINYPGEPLAKFSLCAGALNI